MKNKKRVLTILLILIIVNVLILGIVLIFGGIKNSQVEKFQKTVEEAACKFADDENITEGICKGFENLCKIHYDKLINRNYLESDLINPLTKEKIKDNTRNYIQVTWENDKMICTYKEG